MGVDGDRVVVSADLASYTNITLPSYNISAPRFAVAYGAGRLVAVGNGGEISSSTDGMTWTQRGATGARSVTYAAAFLNDKWLAVGTAGGLLTSPDGVGWTRQSSPAIVTWRGCAYGAGRYVVVSDNTG